MAKLILGIALVMVLAGLCLGAIGAAVLGNEPYVKLPAVHIAPQAVVEFGDRSDVWDFGQFFSGFTITNTLISAWLTTGLVVLLLILESLLSPLEILGLRPSLALASPLAYSAGFLRGRRPDDQHRPSIECRRESLNLALFRRDHLSSL